jgi:hypothetical protein
MDNFIMSCYNLPVMVKFDSKQEGTFAIVAALTTLFSAMWDSIISVIVSITLLVGYGIYKFMQK